jgi:O-antigen ligase
VLAFSFTPRALTERYGAFGSEGQLEEAKTGKIDARNRIFRATIESFPEYWAMGVGAGYYWKSWGPRKGFRGLGPHNGFFAAWIFYGIPGFLLIGLTCFVAARVCMKLGESSPEFAVLLGLLALALFWLMFTHNLYLKSFGVILGLLMGANYRRTRNHARSKAVQRRPLRRNLRTVY